MLDFLQRRWFLLALFGVLLVGFPFAQQLHPAVSLMPSQWVVAAVMFLMALPLEIRTMWNALRKPTAMLLAVGVNFVVVPLLAYWFSPLLLEELGTGLIIVGVIPCTMASVSVWTRRAGGNDAIATMVTMVTNLSCFIVTPFWLELLTGAEVPMPVGELMQRLFLVVVVPTFAAQAVRLCRPVGAWATRHKVALGVVTQLGILSMVVQGTVGSGVELAQNDQSLTPWDWTSMIVVVSVVHVLALVAGHAISRLFGLARPERIAVGFGGSQKTLMVGLDLGLEYFGSLTILPMVAYHVCQLLIDTVVADKLRAGAAEAPPIGEKASSSKHQNPNKAQSSRNQASNGR